MRSLPPARGPGLRLQATITPQTTCPPRGEHSRPHEAASGGGEGVQKCSAKGALLEAASRSAPRSTSSCWGAGPESSRRDPGVRGTERREAVGTGEEPPDIVPSGMRKNRRRQTRLMSITCHPSRSNQGFQQPRQKMTAHTAVDFWGRVGAIVKVGAVLFGFVFEIPVGALAGCSVA